MFQGESARRGYFAVSLFQLTADSEWIGQLRPEHSDDPKTTLPSLPNREKRKDLVQIYGITGTTHRSSSGVHDR
jgi:hypothetical protein